MDSTGSIEDPRSRYGEQDENGIDLSLIRRNLQLTPGRTAHSRETGHAGISFFYANMAGDTEKSDLLQIAEILIARGVEFIVVGGQAETIFGSARVTY